MVRTIAFAVFALWVFSGLPLSWFHGSPFGLQHAEADFTDFAVYRESGGGGSITTAITTLSWDTTVQADTPFSLDAGNQYIDLGDAGHYLLLYSVGLESTGGSNRSEIQGAIDLDNNDSAYGRSSCYIRRTGGTDECWLSGGAIIETQATGTDVSIEVYRTDGNTTASVGVRPDDSGINLLKLNDEWDYARIREVGGGQSFNTSAYTTVLFDTDDELDADTFSRSGGDITLKAPGHYLVTSNVHFRSGTNDRRSNTTRLTLDGFELPGTRTTAFPRGTDSTQDSVASWVGIIYATTSDQVLRLEGACSSASCSSVTNVGDNTAITIAKITDAADYIRLKEATGGQQVDGTDDPVLWDTNLELDTASFSHSVVSNTSRVEIDADGDYLFMSSFWSDRTSVTDGDRLYPHWEWRETGVKQPYGGFGRYNRGYQGSSPVYESGASGGLILEGLTASDYVELVNTDESTGSDPLATFVGEHYGLQGVRIDTLSKGEISVAGSGLQKSGILVGSADTDVGGTFILTDNTGVHTITDITITETGTVDAAVDLDNIRLYYDLDTSFPYDCASESFSGTSTETQFGATDTDGFSGPNGTSTFTGTLSVSTTQSACLYVVLDVGAGANDGDTIEIEIADPNADVGVVSATADPNGSSVLLPGTTSVLAQDRDLVHYHWRQNNGTETTATSLTGGAEDTAFRSYQSGTIVRLRMAVSNEGSATSSATQYRLEYGQKVTTCADIASWTDASGIMQATPNLNEGADTTNIAVATGGVSDENTTFLATNGGVRDISSQTGPIVLEQDEFVELEYAIGSAAPLPEGATYCFRVTDAGAPLETYSIYPELSVGGDLLLQATSTQVATTVVGTVDEFLGGAFVISDQVDTSSDTITSITITETGTVNAQTGLDNIRLYYDLDTSFPYDCASESFSGTSTETQFGATDTDGFSGPNGTSTFTGSATVSSTTAACFYVVADVTNQASRTQTIDIEITSPGSDIVAGGASITPLSSVLLPGETVIESGELHQVHYHWRNDDGSESGASSATGGVEDSPLPNILLVTTYRLRVGVSNEGAATTSDVRLRLEYGVKGATCNAVSTWYDVGDYGGAWDLVDSVHITDGNDTTNIAVVAGGVSDEEADFKTPNAALKDTSSQTAGINFGPTNFAEAEYSLEATDSAVRNATYCFRLTNAGTPLDQYTSYAEATIGSNADFYIQRGVSTIDTSTVTITAGVDYVAPAASTSAFIRITNTQHTGAGNDTGGGNQNADDVTVYIRDASNITNSVTFERFGTIGNTRIYWEIVEYIGPPGGDNEIIVQAQQYTLFPATGNIASTTVSGVTDDDSVVVWVTGHANPDTGLADYNTSLVTTQWDGVNDEVGLTRGEAGNDAIRVSWALVEFTGANWSIQRVEHNYTTYLERTRPIVPVNSLERAFLHVQKRTNLEPGLDEYGHRVWLSSTSTVSFELETSVSTPINHTSVAWVIENTQTAGAAMKVQRQNGVRPNSGSEPETFVASIGTPVADETTTSLHVVNSSTGTGTAFPRPIMGIQLLSTSTYEIWRSDTGQNQTYRTEVVEWPTATRKLVQNYYRFYVNNDLLDPTDPWPAGPTHLGENTAITGSDSPPIAGSQVRIRMSVQVTGANMSASTTRFKLQYGEQQGTCSAVSSWRDVGAIGSTTALWRGTSTPIADGAPLSGNPAAFGALNLSVADRAGTFEEENLSAPNPYKVFIGEDIEYDWIVENNGATSTYCFRMALPSGTPLDSYEYYPTMVTALYTAETRNWRWYDDETSVTPATPLAAENTAPVDIGYDNVVKLRWTIAETQGRDGEDIKLKLQYSETSDFTVATDLAEIVECTALSTWCYADGAGVDNALIASSTLSDADACVAGVGSGCGTHNESGTSTSSYTHGAYDNAEFEFTLRHAGAKPNTTYFFRAFDVTSNTPVSLGPSESYPSLITEGATLIFTVNGIDFGTSIADILTDATTTSTEVPFGVLTAGTTTEAAQRLTVTTNAQGGYHIFAYERQGLLYGAAEIPEVLGTNAVPLPWASACSGLASGCYGYHTTDGSLSTGSTTRFADPDTYAAFSTTSSEIAYASQPVTDESTDIVYRILVRGDQPAGEYRSHVVYIVIPIH